MESRVDNPSKIHCPIWCNKYEAIDRPTNLVCPRPSTGCDAWNGSLSVLEIWCFHLLTYVA